MLGSGGDVFGFLMAVAALFSASALPLPLLGPYAVLPMSIRATMPSTALLALARGVAGGALGALSGGWPRGLSPGTPASEAAAPEPD